ncbi:MAG TPA: CcmD family protein [Vicinamibacterales bacterium]
MRMLRTAAALLCAACMPAVLLAQQTDDFVPVDPAEHGLEQLPAAPMVMAAYAIVWLILIGYVWSLRRRQARVELEMAALRARINERPAEEPRRP